MPVQYDPMLAKLIAAAETRDAAIGRAIAALRGFPILGVRTNMAFLIDCSITRPFAPARCIPVRGRAPV